jgi:hypothetical protein
VVSTGTQSLVPALVSSTPPVLQATGNTIQLTYSLALAASPALPAPDAFTVTVDGSASNSVLSVTRQQRIMRVQLMRRCRARLATMRNRSLRSQLLILHRSYQSWSRPRS